VIRSLLTGIVLAVVVSSGAAAAVCDSVPKTAPRSSFNTDFRSTATRPAAETVSKQQLQQISRGQFSPDVMGLNEARPSLEIRYRKQVVRWRGTRCTSGFDVSIVGRLEQRVFADEKFAAESCIGRVIRDHEQQHVRFNREGYRAMEQQVKRDLRRVARAVERRWYPEGEMDGWLRAELGAVVERGLAHFSEVVEPKHAAIDTPQAYRRQQAHCR